MGQLVRVTFHVHLRWRDRRLNFRNLQDNPSLNVIAVLVGRSRTPFGPFHGSVWHPKVQVQDNERLAGEVVPHVQLFVRKMSPGQDVITDYVYKGAENDLEYSMEFESNVHCELSLAMYPFDSQRCSITVTVTNVINQAVQYPTLPLHPVHPALPPHPEFIITALTLRLENQSTTGCLTFTLHRRPAHHLFSTFLPTILLHLIGYSSFFLPLDNFQDRSVMSLTTLLALVALYSESLGALPSTSYLKHLDIWFVFSIAFLTATVITHLGINDHNSPVTFLRKESSCPSLALWQRLRFEFQSRSTDWKLMLGAKVGLGVTYVLFQCIYWGRVFSSW
ncbi:ligand-gated ion channel 50-like isoform X2 [Portunus trituberculatus]|uniref:ligand-gated ion channel 50-like isoform X2 n=1 Tax=Portunus trituberculatus TaxID=210409 RepID=UPI001E1CC89A|nr:ligand-gated ion channel 50-like isoform X2 [Portunus trituberculatus]